MNRIPCIAKEKEIGKKELQCRQINLGINIVHRYVKKEKEQSPKMPKKKEKIPVSQEEGDQSPSARRRAKHLNKTLQRNLSSIFPRITEVLAVVPEFSVVRRSVDQHSC